MESSSPSATLTEPPPHRWSNIFGTAIALLTLTLPLYFIASFSSQPDANNLTRTSFSLKVPGD